MITNQHIPIMSNELLSFIDCKKEQSILDCTFGGGGHSKFLEMVIMLLLLIKIKTLNYSKIKKIFQIYFFINQILKISVY